MKKILITFFIVIASVSYGQKSVYKYYVYLTDSSLAPEFENFNGRYQYVGNDFIMADFFKNYDVIKFEQALPTIALEEFAKIELVETNSKELIENLMKKFPTIFSKYEDISNLKVELLSYPDDYGTTNPTPTTIPFPGSTIQRSELDYINTPKAWDINTGYYAGTTNPVIIGVSDARIKEDYLDFVGKLSFTSPIPWTQSLTYDPTNGYTAHGTQIAAIAAARGNNNFGSTGVCYDCNIVGTGLSILDLIKLADAGARVINMSWTYGMTSRPEEIISVTDQNIINALANDLGIVLVAGAGNVTSYHTNTDWTCGNGSPAGPDHIGVRFYFPASYQNVISVSSVSHLHQVSIPFPSTPDPLLGYCCTSPDSTIIYAEIADAFSNVNANNPYHPIGMIYNGGYNIPCDYYGTTYYPSPNGVLALHTSNSAVDILAPAHEIFKPATFAETGVIEYTGGGTSSAAPIISGTAALMIGTNQCLTADEVDDILKLSTKDVESMEMNQTFTGQIGAGKVESGDAVEFVNEMKKPDGNAVIDNHIFWRFNFFLPRINNALTINNVSFTQTNISRFIARNSIDVTNSDFSPGNNGLVDLMIDETITVCTPETDFAAKRTKFFKQKSLKIATNKRSFKLFPNPNKGTFTIMLNQSEVKDLNILILDVMGKQVYQTRTNDMVFEISLPNLPSGMYMVKLMSNEINETLKFVKQ